MSASILEYEPRLLWKEFHAISCIPRCTGSEDAVIRYITQQAYNYGFTVRHDAQGNTVVYIPPTAGYEDISGIILQAHVDMVCEKNRETIHNFQTDPLVLYVEGEWLKAQGTTLGADNGIAVAMMLALMKGKYEHGPIELLFTVDEEGGLCGALKLDASMLHYTRLINLDSEEEGVFYIGCAGGMNTVGEFPLEWNTAPLGYTPARLIIKGLNGGHSGSEIHRQPGNSIVLLSRLLHELPSEMVHIHNIFGGDRHNAIPREAVAEILIHKTMVQELIKIVEDSNAMFVHEFLPDEKNLSLFLEVIDSQEDYPTRILSSSCQRKMIALLLSLPHGVLNMSRVVDNFVSTSTNLASVHIQKDILNILTLQRSEVASLLHHAGLQVASSFILAGGKTRFSSKYSGWKPNPQSQLLQHAVKVWQREMGTAPHVRSIHAGLECGVIGAKFNNLDMISFGPHIKGAHTPDECAHISSCTRTFSFLCALLKERVILNG